MPTLQSAAMNTLYYGDNLDVLRRYIADESVDLVYLDPPFKSNQNYNVLFVERDGTQAAAQIKAFEDTWRWDEAAARAYQDVVERGGDVSQAMQAFRTLLGNNDMLAYLSMMAPRLVELRRVLKPTGSIYLHCDPTASHYLKLLLDAVFEPQQFLNEIVWKRSAAHSDTRQGMKRCGRLHDVLLLYRKSQGWIWNAQYTPYDPDYIDEFYKHVERGTGRQFASDNLTAARAGGDTRYEWRVKRPKDSREWRADLNDEYMNPKPGWVYDGHAPPKGRIWAYSRENMITFERGGRLIYSDRSGKPRYKRYLDEMPGVPLQDVWTDVPPIPSGAAERLGYPTQKPEALLERILTASSNEGDTVLDPFCGCGTTIAAAQQLKRHWIGIDITSLATTLIKHRLRDAYGDQVTNTYEVIGEPVSLPDARALAASDPYQFQWWALGLIGARPVEQKKGADKGIDGRLYFHDEGPGSATKQIVISVKAGKLHAPYVRDLRGVMDREQAAMGVLLSLEEPTARMRTEAASAGLYESAWGKHPRLQLMPVGELLDGRKLDAPPPRQTSVTFKRVPKAKETKEQPDLPGGFRTS